MPTSGWIWRTLASHCGNIGWPQAAHTTVKEYATLMPFMKSLLYKASKLYMAEAAVAHARTYPQLACFAFDTISVSIHLDGLYERNELEALEAYIWPHLSSEGAAIDIGANIGNHSLFFARNFAHVYALEPHPRTFKLLECNADLVSNVTPIPFGASDSKQDISVVQDLLNLGATSVRASDREILNKTDPIEFKLDRLDDMAGIPRDVPIAFIKLDIEGHEAAALRGAEEILRAHEPVVAMEVLPEDIRNGCTESVEFLRSLGYEHFVASRPVTKIARYSRRTQKRLKFLLSLIGRPPIEKRDFAPVTFPIPATERYSLLICSTRPIL